MKKNQQTSALKSIILDPKLQPGSQRLMCIDALRGFDMLWIIGGAEVLISLGKASGIWIPE